MSGRGGGLNKPCILLIVIAGMERFAYKGVASNLVTYLTDVVGMSNSSAAKTVNSWGGFTSMLPLLVAPMADSHWDQYTTIVVSSLIYFLGLLALTSTAMVRPLHPINKAGSMYLFCSLYMVSIGQGGYNPSLQAFGAEQLESDDELPSTNKNDKTSDKKSMFFHWWYFGICSGSLLGVSLMAYIQDTLGWGLGFAIPAISMFSSLVLFCCGTRSYTHKQQLNGTTGVGEFKFSLLNLVQTFKAAVSRMRKGQYRLANESDVGELELEEKPLCVQDPPPDESLNMIAESGINLTEIAKVVLHLLPVWIMLLMFAVIFQQPATFFTKQGMTMKRNIGSNFKVPPAALQSAITVSIIILMPFYDRFFIPLARVITRSEEGISVMQRMGTGMFLTVVAMVIAALLETKRLAISRIEESETVPLSIFWLLPQYILLGISDIFTVVGMQEFFYREVPIKMRTMGIALYTSVFGVGSFMSAFLISLVEYLSTRGGGKSWFTDDMREARLDKYYWVLASASAISLLTFTVFSRFYKSRA